MTYLRKKVLDNAGVDYFIKIYQCDRCSKEIPESCPRYHDEENNYHLCLDCGFIEGLIPKKEYLESCGIYLKRIDVAYHEGKIIIWFGKKPPWKRSNKDLRSTSKYKQWRQKVFKRDNYTCQKCGKRGGEIHAHHIKSFKSFPKLRYKTDNGLTLCVECHKKKHKKVW